MKRIITLFLIVLMGLIISTDFVFAQGVEINLFYSNTCPHCKKEKEFLKIIKENYPEVKINEYEIIESKENQGLLKRFYEDYEVSEMEMGLIPVTFVSDNYFIGFSEQVSKDIEACLENCLHSDISQEIDIPFFGAVDISKMSLAALTMSLGALDGFNPCAMWVLLFLISLLTNVRSKKRMYLIGGTFVLASGVIYYLILNAWLRLFLAISYVNITRILIGLLALGIGVWQIRNFAKFRPGVCKVTEGEGFQGKIREGLKARAGKLALSPLNLGIIGGVILLAFGVNLVEFFCSAGLPAVFTRVLALSEVSSLSYHLYLLLYTIIFMLDDIIIFLLAVFALNKIGFSEKYNYWATLFGGILIFVLGALLIFRPEILMFA